MVPGEMVCRPRIPRVTRFPAAGGRKKERRAPKAQRVSSFSLSLSLSRASAHFANNLADFGLRFRFILHFRLLCSLLQVNFAFISLHLLLYRPCFMVLGTVSHEACMQRWEILVVAAADCSLPPAPWLLIILFFF